MNEYMPPVQLLGQLVAAIGPVELVLALVDLGRLAQDRPRDLPENRGWRSSTRSPTSSSRRSTPPRPTPTRPARRARAPRRTPRPAHVRGGSESPRSSSDRAPGCRPRRVRRRPPRTPARPPRRPVPARVRVHQQRHHHRRLIGRAAVAVRPIGGIERRHVQLADSVQHRPHQMPLRHPGAHGRRHQKHLLTVNADEPRAHAQRLPARPDSTPFSRQPRLEAVAWLPAGRCSASLPLPRTAAPRPW